MAGDALKTRYLLVVLLCVIFLSCLSPYLGWARAAALGVTQPTIIVSRTTISLRRLFESIRQIGTLRFRVAELEAENSKLKSELVQYKEVGTSDTLVKSQIDKVTFTDPSHLIAARVTGRSPSRALESITIDKGSAEGAYVHQAVLVDGFFAGVIDTVLGHQSQVILLTNPSLIIPIIFQDTRAQGLLRARLDGLIVSDIPNSAAIQSGDVAVTSDLEHVVPRGIPVGTVDRTISADSDILKKVRIRSPIAFQQLEYVLLVKVQPE